MDVATLIRIGHHVLIKKWRQSPWLPQTTLDQELDRAGHCFPSWWRQRRATRRMYVEIGDATVARLKRQAVEPSQSAIRAAERALNHRFDLLGSGYHAIDPDRPALPDGYQPIDWVLDPVRQQRFPRGIPVKDWKLFEMRPPNADIKFPWELARCQHFAALGQAFRLTGETRFAKEILDQIDDFTEANPIGLSVNWTCTMDVALRAANWAIGLALIKHCEAIDASRFRAAYRVLFEHGRFIFANFENTYEVTSNHYLSNVVGLHFLAAEFIETASGRKWDAYCRKAVATEIDLQILPDGADFELSVPYHRLVTELFLGSYRLAQLQGRPLSAHYAERLRDMIAYLIGVMRPDGLMPQLGDADDGRLHIFTDQLGWVRADGRHLLAPAAHALERPEWLAYAGAAGAWEASWWGYEPDPALVAAKPTPLPDHVTLYPDAGAFIARAAGHYLLVSNARVGTKGFGNHKHNDQLSFELHIAGAPVIIDPGSYVYTSDFANRNLFRSTAYHSTLMIDDLEQNEVNPEWLFRMFEKAEAEHLQHGNHGEEAFYLGRHVGYCRLDAAVAHTRRFVFGLATGALRIEDRLEGAGLHDLAWHFHLALGAEVTLPQPGVALISLASGAPVQLTYPSTLKTRVSEVWASPSYGVRVPTRSLDLQARLDVAEASVFAFSLSPVMPSSMGAT